MDCKVTVKSESGEFCSRGKLEKNGKSFKLFYKLDGDECVLSFDGDKYIQSRAGNLNLNLIFKEGKLTYGKIIAEGLSGEIDIFTQSIALISGENGINLKLKYLSGGENLTIAVTATRI